jgi:hypothetical protein
MKPKDLEARCLLIEDSYSSHVTANVIPYYIEHAISLLILLTYYRYIPYLLNIIVFPPLKRALVVETALSPSSILDR